MHNTLSLSRRHFLKLSGAAVLASSACKQAPVNLNFPIQVVNDLLRGHTLFEGVPPQQTDRELRKEVLVVGAGIAGLTAAYAKRDRDLLVCEIGKHPGGSSASGSFQGMRFAQGAHYDLEYPANYGPEVLALLEELHIIHFNSARQAWTFRDTQYLIDAKHEGRAWASDGFREHTLPNCDETRQFEQMVQAYGGKLVMPTRNIAKAYHLLDKVSFREFLANLNLGHDADFLRALDYQLIDDYGAGSAEVSALAGLHYYQCRPYYSEKLPHFSPPQGNAYFVDKLLEKLPRKALWCSHLVTSIEDRQDGFRVGLVDLERRESLHLLVDEIIYAGHKHGLKHVYPKDADLFAANRYAPWIAVNLILDTPPKTSYWQNEVIGADPHFAGLVNSRAQQEHGPYTVLTAYFCLPELNRPDLLTLRDNPKPMIQKTLQVIHTALGQRIDANVVQAFVKLHGHAMPIPHPGYLFRDANVARSHPNLVYAGVDNGYLPLLFEALDSGLAAVRALQPT